MKKLIIILISFLLTPAFSAPITNVSDRCACFSEENRVFDIDHCEPANAVRLVAVFKDFEGKDVRILQPGETIDPALHTDREDVSATRSPGPVQYTFDSYQYWVPLGYSTPLYALPLYHLRSFESGKYYTDSTIMLIEDWKSARSFDSLDLATCTYHKRTPLIQNASKKMVYDKEQQKLVELKN